VGTYRVTVGILTGARVSDALRVSFVLEIQMGTEILWNLLFATLIFFLGGLGIFLTRIAKGKWSNVKWSYIPVFWIPVLSSWPVAISAIMGHFDQ
jgi:ABC-type multidrug transport system permease subunit